jgi:hypothetical protein
MAIGVQYMAFVILLSIGLDSSGVAYESVGALQNHPLSYHIPFQQQDSALLYTARLMGKNDPLFKVMSGTSLDFFF